MDLFAGLISGFKISLLPINLLYCFTGVFIGTLIGVLPGIGPTGTIAILLPITFGISPPNLITCLAQGVEYGA
jgi:putative tricarboxylic transport membrane protein